jgi:hypothetical protein
VGFALPELKMQSFGSKCTDCDEVSTAANPENLQSGVDSFFQVGSEQVVEVSHGTEVGEVVADPQTLTWDNGTSPHEPTQVGFVEAAKPPPALAEVPPLPFAHDDVQSLGHIHVEANIATQEFSRGSDNGVGTSDISLLAANHSGATVSGASTNASSEDEAWINFTAAEMARGRSEAETLGTDAAAEALPASTTAETLRSSTSPALALPLTERPALSTLRPLVQATTNAQADSVLATTARPDVSIKDDSGFVARHSMLLLCLLVLLFMAMLGGCLACAGAGFLASFVWQRRLVTSPVRSQVEELPLCRASEVSRRLPQTSSYDCNFSKPLSTCQLLRIEARIEGPATGSAVLTAPLTGQACVLYSAAVSRQLHDGIRPAPVAFASLSIDFIISLKDSPHVRISLQAEDVSLFDMRRGRHVQRRTFASAPDKWQDFILMHRAGTEWQTSSQLRADSSSLEFQECALLCNTYATFVGELYRGADGTLSLRPLQADSFGEDVASSAAVRSRSAGLSERWRTSWECGISDGNTSSPERTKGSGFDKVMASDDPTLLDGASPLLNTLSSMMRSLGSMNVLRNGRSMSFMSLRRGGKWSSAGEPESHTL